VMLTVACPHCNASIDTNRRFCSNCGSQMTEVIKQPDVWTRPVNKQGSKIKKTALIVAIVYLTLTMLSEVITELPSIKPFWLFVTLVTHSLIAALLFFLILGIGSLIQRRKR
jgi:hypothetical protein